MPSFTGLTNGCCVAVVKGKAAYVYVSEVKSWYSALKYCRQHHIDFPVIEYIHHQSLVYSAFPPNNIHSIWLGLYRIPWIWSDGSQSSFRNWTSSESENYKDEKLCVSARSNSEWSDFNCSSKHPFICQQGDSESRWTCFGVWLVEPGRLIRGFLVKFQS